MDFKGTMYCVFLIATIFVGYNYLNVSTDVFASFDLVDKVGLQGNGVNGSLSMLNLFIADFIFFITTRFSQLSTFIVERIDALGKEAMSQTTVTSSTKSIFIISLVPFFPFLMAIMKPYEM